MCFAEVIEGFCSDRNVSVTVLKILSLRKNNIIMRSSLYFLLLFAFLLNPGCTSAQDIHTPPTPQFEFIFEATVTLDPPKEVGMTKYGKRRIIGINGGTFEGPNMKGIVLSGGADWQTVRADGTADLVAKYSLQTDDGVIIFIENTGIRTAAPEVLARLAKGEDVPSSQYYMRTAASFEVDKDSKYSWLNNSVVISTGVRKANSVILHFYKVL